MAEVSLLERVGDRLCEADAMVAVAESSTGGLLCSRLTDRPGSSEYFDRGVVSYSNRAKVDLLGVDGATLDTHGAVSGPTAREMATGVCDLAGVAFGVSTTGVAGPGGGTPETPVGTVYIAVARSTGGEATIRSADRYEFGGTRQERKRQFVRQALADLLSAVE